MDKPWWSWPWAMAQENSACWCLHQTRWLSPCNKAHRIYGVVLGCTDLILMRKPIWLIHLPIQFCFSVGLMPLENTEIWNYVLFVWNLFGGTQTKHNFIHIVIMKLTNYFTTMCVDRNFPLTILNIGYLYLNYKREMALCNVINSSILAKRFQLRRLMQIFLMLYLFIYLIYFLSLYLHWLNS